jgi:hypothetical protein
VRKRSIKQGKQKSEGARKELKKGDKDDNAVRLTKI